MYRPIGPPVLGLAFAGGTLAITGVTVLWWLVTGFTLIVAGFALLHLMPKTQR